MSRKKFAIVVGTRPEVIKMAPVYAALADDPRAEVELISTAQHREMLDQALAVFSLTADVDLDLMRPGQTPVDVLSAALTGLSRHFERSRPDVVLVQGDTTTVLAGALAAFYLKIPVAHVEAGLRTHDLMSPWPEEMHRKLADPLSRWCFAATEDAARNLRAEGTPDAAIHVTGNTAIDALHMAVEICERSPPNVEGLPAGALDGRRLILATAHRRENLGARMESVCLALRDLVLANDDVVVVLPVHLNPTVRKTVFGSLTDVPRVHLIPPTDYLSFVHLMHRSQLIVTDSGGIQEEAPALGKPVLVTRTTTERAEAVESGQAVLLGTDRTRIVATAQRLLDDPAAYSAMVGDSSPFGDGHAARRIAEVLLGAD